MWRLVCAAAAAGVEFCNNHPCHTQAKNVEKEGDRIALGKKTGLEVGKLVVHRI